MQVIENKYNSESQKVQCEKCSSTFMIDESDLDIGTYGCKFWTCPYCNQKNLVDDSIELTESNFQFPQHFASYKDGKQISEETLQKWAQEALASLDKDHSFALHASGNSLVFAYKSDYEAHEAAVVICDNGYYETYIDLPEDRF